MKLFQLICYLVALIMFILAAFNNAPARWNLMAIGLAAWVLVPLALLVQGFS